MKKLTAKRIKRIRLFLTFLNYCEVHITKLVDNINTWEGLQPSRTRYLSQEIQPIKPKLKIWKTSKNGQTINHLN